MSTRILAASIVALAGLASPALAFHPQGGSTHFFGLTWGHGPTGGATFPNSTGFQQSGFHQSGFQSLSLQPMTFQPMTFQPLGIQSLSFQPMTFQPLTLAPNNLRSADVEAQGLRDWLALLSRGCQIINTLNGLSSDGTSSGTTPAGLTPASVTALATGTKADLAAIRALNEQMLLELRQIRKLDASDPAGMKNLKDLKFDEKKVPSGAATPVNPASYATIDRDLNDIAALRQKLAAPGDLTALRQELAAKNAKLDELRAARKAAPAGEGTGVAIGR